MTEEKGIWDEKPKPTIVYVRSAEWNGRDRSEYYQKRAMDVFHEKLKDHYGPIKEKAEKLGDISAYPEIKFGHMTVLDFLDLVELQADTYTARALIAEKKLRAVKTAFEDHRDNLIELSGNLNQIAHEPELPEEYHYAIEKIATNIISYGELRKILEAEE